MVESDLFLGCPSQTFLSRDPLAFGFQLGSGSLDLVYFVAFVAILLFAIWALLRLLSPPTRATNVVAVDQPSLGGMRTLSSDRYRLSGKPDELRRTPNGRIIPVEIKSTRSPRNGIPYPSHRVQLLAYCLLVEETFRSPPPFGIVVYGDGSEYRVAWDAAAKREFLSVLELWSEPYMGALDPGYGKCRSCQFKGFCPGAKSVGVAG